VNYELANTVAVYYHIHLTAAEINYYATMSAVEHSFSSIALDDVEAVMVGAGVGKGFVDTNELHTMTYDAAMASKERNLWERAVDEEHQNLKDYNVFEVVKRDNMPKGSKVLSTTWVMKRKASGRYKARITARGFEQRDGEHYDSSDKSSPVVNDITIRIILTIIVMAGFSVEVVDVKGAFLTAEFDPSHRMYITVPRGFEKHYPGNVVLLLKRTLYGTCQAAIQFWKKLCGVMASINLRRSKADARVYELGRRYFDCGYQECGRPGEIRPQKALHSR
jgi:hypothetical protein